MGLVRMGIPEELTLFLKEEFQIRNFVEGGTYHGETAFWASQHFNNIETIEQSEFYYNLAKRVYGHIKSIQFTHGDTRNVLPKILSDLNEPAIFWLDSHWCGGQSYGVDDECPLLDEIEILNRSAVGHFVLIDDARLFLTPPPRPHRIESWPNIVEVLDVLGRDRYVVVYDDVIVAVPASSRDSVSAWMQNATTNQWEDLRRVRQEGREGRIRRILKRVARIVA